MTDNKGEAKMKITPRGEDFSEWYQDVIAAAELADYAPVKGCMVIRPNGFAIWENIQKILDQKFKDTGVENAYFPLFIPHEFLEREKKHVEGFSPELAVVTHAGGKKLDESLVVRPTSETIIYDSFSKWIHSWRDLPLKINQWCNVVRWEMRTRLFLRTSEFLWQEGHTAHKTAEEAEEEAKTRLEMYKNFLEEYLAIPVLAGQKSENEKFAGALRTYTFETMTQDKKALQGGTSHNLGQNFSKVFNVKFLDEKGENQFVWQTSWGVSTRLIGALIMAHGDDKGIILPPKIAPVQVAFVPIWKDEKERELVEAAAQKLALKLQDTRSQRFRVANAGEVRYKIDERDQRPAWKFYDWERKGVPIRVEIGPKDLEKNQAVCVRRDTGEKIIVPQSDLADKLPEILEEIQKNLFDRALKFQQENTHEINSWEEFKNIIENKKGFLNALWCGESSCELKIKEETKATIRCIPFDQPKVLNQCVHCGKSAKHKVIFAIAY